MAATTTSAIGGSSDGGDDPVGDFYVHLSCKVSIICIIREMTSLHQSLDEQ
jgi:hypothetical protein